MGNKVTKLTNEGGSPVEIQDFDLDALAGATAKTASQVSTTAQYVPLQDVDGNLVKINMSSFQEAVRNVLGSLLLNNDKGTTISALPALAGSGSSIDFGSITPANLASVLGAVKYINYESNGFDCNSLEVRTLVNGYANITNGPQTIYLCVLTIGLQDSKLQIAWNNGSGITTGSRLYVRHNFDYNTTIWTAWKQVAFTS